MSLEGRWTVYLDTDINELVVDGPQVGREDVVPVVPCDDAAIQRAALAVHLACGYGVGENCNCREMATVALRAAGETP